MSIASTQELAERLIQCQDRAAMMPPITADDPDFDVERAYDVLAAINARREAQGWRSIGRKIGFTNRTIWARYGVYQPMWAPVWSQTVQFARDAHASLPLAGFVQPRIEPEIVLKLSRSPPMSDDPQALLATVEWIAAGFEIVQSVFPAWKFAAADCTAASGLHGALIVGPPLAVGADNTEWLATRLATFELALSCDGREVERGGGSNVLGSPLNALVHLVRVLAAQPRFPQLTAGEIVTTGTLTDAWPVRRGEIWRSDYDALGVEGLTLRCD